MRQTILVFLAALILPLAAAGRARADITTTFNQEDSVQTFTVTTTGTYIITVAGGGGTDGGGGGGSYIAADFSDTMLSEGVNSGSGLVTIDEVITATPEPSSLVTTVLGILGLAGYGWRRRPMAPAV